MSLMLQDIHRTSTVSAQQEQSRRLKSCTQNASIGDQLRCAWHICVIESSCKRDTGCQVFHESASQSCSFGMRFEDQALVL